MISRRDPEQENKQGPTSQKRAWKVEGYCACLTSCLRTWSRPFGHLCHQKLQPTFRSLRAFRLHLASRREPWMGKREEPGRDAAKTLEGNHTPHDSNGEHPCLMGRCQRLQKTERSRKQSGRLTPTSLRPQATVKHVISAGLVNTNRARDFLTDYMETLGAPIFRSPAARAGFPGSCRNVR